MTSGDGELELSADATVPEAREPSTAFPVVGVGASAGGLEALETFFSRMPRTGMAFIIIQHLAPDRESHLPEILSRSTRLPVTQAKDGIVVEPDHVYVIPPGVNLAMYQGRLHLMEVPRAPAGDPLLPVDFFFQSMARDCGARCMGVVLSGTGIDGMRGLQEIREAGGLTFAQDPSTAKFQGMPTAAAVGADSVLSPESIAEELARISRHPYVARGAVPPEGEEGLKRLFLLIRSAFGTDLSFYKFATVHRRIERRMALNKVERIEDYVRLVQSHPGELKTLYRDLLINVTNFFRDGEPFEVLRDVVFPRIIERKKPGDAIRVWVPGCSTGEEAYSIGVSLLEALGDRAQEFRLQIFATDLDDEAISRARLGVYPPSISTDVSPERLRRFFQRRESGYEVGRRLRELVVFATHDLTRDAPFSRLDLCSCRNVLIYLQGPLQKRVLRLLHYSLAPDGFMVLGSSETVGDTPELFSIFDKKNRVYVKKSLASLSLFELDGVTLRDIRGTRSPHPNLLRPVVNLQQLADRKVLERFGPAGVLVNEALEVLQFRGRTGPYLEPQPGTATLNLLKLARPELHVELRTATHRALSDNVPTAARHVGLRTGDDVHSVSIEVHPLRDPETNIRCLLVLFRMETETVPNEEPLAPPRPLPIESRTDDLERELASTKEYLQSAIEELETSNEELKSANEELQSSNEELQSTNEELETSKEELQSTNEELSTVNDELQSRMEELSVSNDDLVNLLASVETLVVMVGMDLRLRRLTESAERLFGLSSEDLNRPVSILRPFMPQVELERLCRNVIDRLVPARQEVHAADGRAFELRVRPYRTVDHVIGGAVLSFVPLDSGQSRGEAVSLSSVPTPALVLDSELRVVAANDAAVDAFAQGKVNLVGLPVERLGFFEPADTKLRHALERTLREGASFRYLRVGERRVHAARLARGANGPQLLLLLDGKEDETQP
ncbi:MAG TPA: chemotaxis protein CheB [Myxococcaceae bacterium]|nr:chemotaxis protein CheB [Myxococcaceae bacterium]